jgi:hypothetical protein
MRYFQQKGPGDEVLELLLYFLITTFFVAITSFPEIFRK